MKSFFASASLSLLVLLPATAGAGDKNPAAKEPLLTGPRPLTGHWRLSAGAVWRSFGDAEWRSGPSRSSGVRLPWLAGQAHSPGFGSAGPAGAYADREYADGFIRVGSPTANTGDTWNWGYDSAAQVVGDSVYFHTGAGFSSRLSHGSDSSETSWNSDDTDGVGPVLSMDYLFDLRPGVALGPQFSFMFTRFDVANRFSNFTAFQERRDYSNTLTDSYELAGTVPPDAPYAGSYGGPGLLLRNRPDSRTFSQSAAGGEQVEFRNSVSESVDVDLYTFSLGPVFEYSSGRFSARGGLGLAINLADIQADRVETLHVYQDGNRRALEKWHDRRSDTDILFGFYLSAEASCALTDKWSVSLFGRRDWNEDISGTVGPSSYRIDMDAWTVGGSVSWRF